MDIHGHHQPPKRVVVCGGGIIGVCTAYYLAKKGATVTLIEQSSIAGAATGKAGAFLARHMCDGVALSSLARASFDLHRSLAQELDGPRSYGYRPLTTLTISINKSEPKPRGERGATDTILSNISSLPEPESSVTVLPLWVDGGGVKAGEMLGTAETTAQIEPEMFCGAVLEKAVAEYGVEVVMGKVVGVGVEGEGVVVTVDGGGVVGGDEVVLALGPWTSTVAELEGKFKVFGKKVHSVVLEPQDGDAITPHALFGTYYPDPESGPVDPDFFPRPNGDVYICGPSVEVEIPEGPESVSPEPESIQMLKTVAGIVSTHLAEDKVRVKSEGAGLMPCTYDELPIMGEVPGMKGCYVASGHGYWGVLFGPATGVAMAELVLDGKATIVDIHCFSPARFTGRKV